MARIIKKFLGFYLVIILFGSCQETLQKADLIITNGKIYTMDEKNPEVEAVAVLEGKIVKTGKKNELNTLINEKTKIIDLNGAIVYPGFIEGHAHLMGIGANLLEVDLMQVVSYEELVSKVKEKASGLPKGTWILGRGWHQDKWQGLPENVVKGFPTHHLLSAEVPDHPVFLKHASGHAALANAKAMELAGINKETEQPEGGEIIMGLNGSPTGLMNETAQGLFQKVLPDETEELLIKKVELAMQHCFENGITSFHQAGSDAEEVSVYKTMAERNELKLRMYVMLNGRDSTLLSQFFNSGPYFSANDQLTIRSVKLYADGALGSRGAWLTDEYSDAPGVFGHVVTPLDEVSQVIEKCVANGFQACTHAIGDRANHQVLDIYEEKLKMMGKLSSDHRFRVEHAQHILPEDLDRFSKLRVIPAMQAIHMSSDRPWAIYRLGRNRIEEGAYMWQRLLESGAKIVNGTDAPVEPVSPFASLYASITRKTLKGTPETGYESEQRMTRYQAIKSYTLDAAYGAFEENIKGSIETGKLADFTILDTDIFTCNEEQILSTKVLYTIVGGEIVFKSN